MDWNWGKYPPSNWEKSGMTGPCQVAAKTTPCAEYSVMVTPRAVSIVC